MILSFKEGDSTLLLYLRTFHKRNQLDSEIAFAKALSYISQRSAKNSRKKEATHNGRGPQK